MTVKDALDYLHWANGEPQVIKTHRKAVQQAVTKIRKAQWWTLTGYDLIMLRATERLLEAD